MLLEPAVWTSRPSTSQGLGRVCPGLLAELMLRQATKRKSGPDGIVLSGSIPRFAGSRSNLQVERHTVDVSDPQAVQRGLWPSRPDHFAA